jgi:type II secretory pathway pseudopilin PulG
LFVVSMMAILAAAAIPPLAASVERTRAMSAARYLAGRLSLARAQAVARAANVALLLTRERDALTAALYADGNGNGVRRVDVDAGIDPPLGSAVRLDELFPSLQILLDDPASLTPSSASALMSFSPIGTASSRTLYVRARDGSMYAVRVLGATGRTRVLRFVPGTGEWIEVI